MRDERPRGLVLVMSAAGAAAAWASAPAGRGAPCDAGYGGLEEAGQVRLLCLDDLERRADSRAAACGLVSAHAGPGDVVWGRCAQQVRPLGLSARVAMGLSVDLDRLIAQDLAEIPGIGPRLARRILEARATAGGFRSVDDLATVPGVGPARLKALRAALNAPR